MKNLDWHIDAEAVSKKLEWPITQIIVKPAETINTKAEYFLTGCRSEKKIDELIRKFQNQSFGNSNMLLEKITEPIEYCPEFRISRCSKSATECFFEHIPCRADGDCPFYCPLGHGALEKMEKLPMKG